MKMLSKYRPIFDIFTVGDHWCHNEWHNHNDSNIVKTDNGVDIYTEMPGFAKDDISITINHGILKIEGKKVQEQNNKYISRYQKTGFVNEYDISGYNEDSIEASLKDGILVISIKKKPEEDKRKIIKIT